MGEDMGEEEEKEREIAKAVARAVWETEISKGIEELTTAVMQLTDRVQQLEKRYLIVCGILVLLGQAVGIGVGEILQHFLGGGGPVP